MTRPLFLLPAQMIFLLASYLAAQTTPPFGAPKSMRLCAGRCENLNWVKDHYEGVRDGEEAVTTNYTIVRWQSDGIELRAVNVKSARAGMEIFAILTGTPAQGGGSITNGKATWHILSQVTTIPLQITWQPAPIVAAPTPPSPSPAQPRPVSPTSAVPAQPPPGGLPRAIFECESTWTAPSCATWLWNGNQYDGSWSNGIDGKLAVESMASGEFVITRADTRDDAKVTYSGKWAGNQVIGGKVDFTFRGNHSVSGFTASLEPEVSSEISSKLLIARGSADKGSGLRQMRLHGVVRLAFSIWPIPNQDSALVNAVRVLSEPQNQLLDEAAMQVVSRSVYHPYLLNGKPIAIRTTVEIPVP